MLTIERKKYALLIGVAAGALAAGFAAHAEEEAPGVSEVIVTASPIVGSQRAALIQQREADNLVNVIAADSIGQFPDQNSAAALARVPAVAVQRDQGQERYLQVRGAPNRWTSVSVDGVTVIGVDEGGGQRAFRFDAVPAVILNGLEVNKSLTPDLSAEAVVARVNLRTFSPFDQSGFRLQADGAYGKMDLGGGPQKQYGGRVSWSGEKFGVIAAASHYSREQTTDNREFDYDANGLVTALDFRSYIVTRESNAGLLGVEYRQADGHKIFAKSLYSEFNDDEERNQYVFQIASALSGTRTATGGDLVGVPVRGSFNYGEYRNSNWVNTIGGDHATDTWDVSWRLNYTETENTTNLPIVLQQQATNLQRPSITYDRTDPNFPTINLYRTVAAGSGFARGAAMSALDQVGTVGVNIVLPLTSAVTSDSWVYKADASRIFQIADRDVRVSFGAQYDDRKVDGSILSGSAPAIVLNSLLPRIGRTFNPGDYFTGSSWDSGFPRGFDVMLADNKRMRGDIDTILAAAQTAGLYNPAANVAPADRYSISEKLLAGYGMAKFDLGAAQIVTGLRIERMDQSIDGFVTAGAVITPLSYGAKSTDAFPSINAKFDVMEDTVLRLAAQTGISRPSFGTVRTGASISDLSRTVSGGNPGLKPEKTWGGDVSLERYLPGAGMISAGAFYRHVSDVHFDSREQVTDERYNTGGVDRRGYDFITTLNGDDGRLYGLELAYLQQFVFLPGPFDGFGFQGNISFLDGEFDTPEGLTAPFPGTSKKIANASIFYEKYGLSARLSYQWRDRWVDTLSLAGYGDQYRKGYESLDLSLRYAVNSNLSLFLDANNLTDETYVAYEGDEQHPSEVEQIGRRFLAGVRLSF